LFVVEINNRAIAFSEVKDEADGFTLPDEIFTEERKLKEKWMQFFN
jgi:hypothetical protein